MSICNPCIKAKPIPKCTQEIEIGTISDIDTAVSVYIWDVSSSLIQRVDATSDGDGLITVDISEVSLLASHAYEIWVTEAGANYKEKLSLTIGTSASETICLRVEEVKGTDGEMELYASQTLLEA